MLNKEYEVYKHEAETSAVLLDRCLALLKVVAIQPTTPKELARVIADFVTLLEKIAAEDDPVKTDTILTEYGLTLHNYIK